MTNMSNIFAIILTSFWFIVRSRKLIQDNLAIVCSGYIYTSSRVNLVWKGENNIFDEIIVTMIRKIEREDNFFLSLLMIPFQQKNDVSYIL